ncbi:CUB and sushi domain-containing protein 1-like [Oscarella lobularis]|uniref:CUB and sushi domain-containing protein 1-like n=1 Tax=Oscarella lobularis TaxID=121494 RepID=UPI0033143412
MFFAALLLLLQHSICHVLSQAPLRLVGGSTRYEGRVEISYNSTWGTVCDDGWDIDDANVVCRQLFQTSAYKYLHSAHFGEGSETIWLDDVGCTGNETSFDRCYHRGWGSHNCGHNEDAGVVCNTDEVRLVGGTSIYEDRVEIFHNNEWGTVCDDSWGLYDAHVVCRQLGYGSATAARCCATFGLGSGTIWLDEVACSGSEQTLASCSANSWGGHNCGHNEDAGVICHGPLRPCVALATPVHGSKSGNSTVLAASVSFSCSLGYTLSGSSRRTCLIDGTWSGSQPTCNAVDCGSLPAPSYGSFSGSSTLYGATIRFSCNAGYSLSGSSSRSCASSGQWNGSQPTCNRIYCPLLSRPSFGSISTSSRTFGTTVTFSCSLGYRLVGSSSRSCQISGSWTGSAASCIVVTCASLSTPLNGVKTGTSVTYGSIVKFSCKSGYTLSGSSSRSCSASGDLTGTQPVCTPTRCPALAPLSHGHMSSTSVSAGTIVSFSCSKGYTLSGSTTRTCQLSGSWSGTQPTCTIVNCGGLSTPSNAVKTGNSTSFGAIVSFTCSQLRLRYHWFRPKCSLVDCGALAAPAHGTKTGSRTTYGARMSFQCSLGYVRAGSSSRTCQSDGTWSGTQPSCLSFTLQGSKSRTCQANGTWSGQPVSCEQVYCSALSSVSNGVRTGNGTLYASVVKFGCKTGYKLYGSSSRTCQNDGTWSGSQPTCSLQHCSLLSDPPNGKVTGGSSAHGMSMTYVCNAGYNVTSGSRTRSCLAKPDGSVYWSGTAARCAIIDCGRLSALQNGQITGKSTVYLSTVSLSCNVGYNIGGSVKRTCQANGQWSGFPTVCKIVNCGQFPAPIFGSISGATTYGSSVILSCRKGFSLFGSSRRTCQADGSWTGAATHCKIVDCGVVKSPANGQVTVLNTTYGSVASFQCNSGHRLVGPSSRQCQANGQWSSIPTLCDALYCSAIGTPLHGFRQPVLSNFVYGTSLSFTCALGRTLVGRSTTQCVESSQNLVKVNWTNSLPTCDVVPKLVLNLTASDRTEQRSRVNLVAYAAGVSQSSEDNPLTLSCYPAKGAPIPRVTWYYGQTIVNATPSSAVYQTYDSVTGTSYLTFNEFGNKNEGSYKCVAMN